MARRRRTGKQRAASRRNLVKARRAQKGTWTPLIKTAIRGVANAATMGAAGSVSNFIEGKDKRGQKRR